MSFAVDGRESNGSEHRIKSVVQINNNSLVEGRIQRNRNLVTQFEEHAIRDKKTPEPSHHECCRLFPGVNTDYRYT